jgi:hypothetical protein
MAAFGWFAQIGPDIARVYPPVAPAISGPTVMYSNTARTLEHGEECHEVTDELDRLHGRILTPGRARSEGHVVPDDGVQDRSQRDEPEDEG